VKEGIVAAATSSSLSGRTSQALIYRGYSEIPNGHTVRKTRVRHSWGFRTYLGVFRGRAESAGEIQATLDRYDDDLSARAEQAFKCGLLSRGYLRASLPSSAPSDYLVLKSANDGSLCLAAGIPLGCGYDPSWTPFFPQW
jgi:hypothetical protein